MSGTNPFAALLGGTSEKSCEPQLSKPNLKELLEEIFSFSLNQESARSKKVLYLEEVHNVLNSTELNLENIDQALCERLFMCDKENLAIIQCKNLGLHNEHAVEIKPITYLYKAYVKLNGNRYLQMEHLITIKNKVLQNVVTSILQPDMYVNQNLEQQMLEILREAGSDFDTFFVDACKRIIEDDESKSLTMFITQMNRILTVEVQAMSLGTVDHSVFNYLNVFTTNGSIAEIFMDCCVPKNISIGSEYTNTVIGALLNLSVLPKTPRGQYEHFTTPLDQHGNARMEGILWTALDELNEHFHQFVLPMLKVNNNVRNKLLTWLGGCLKSNIDRGKLWNSQAPPELNPANYTTVSDGFVLNFCSLLLRLCRPFCSDFKDKKILKVDPTYPAVPNDKLDLKGVHMYELSSETCFLPRETNDGQEEQREIAEKYSFITESFFMAHKALDLGYRVSVDRMMKMSQEIANVERAYRDAVQQTGATSEVAKSLNSNLMAALTKLFSLKCVLSEPKLLKDMFDFVSATSFWLAQVALKTELGERGNFAPLDEKQVVFPLPEKVPHTLNCIPEFLIENIVSCMVFLRRFSPRTFEEVGYEKLEPVLTFILIFMGSPRHLKNPHIRAKLAEGLESMLPYHKNESFHDLGHFQRELLFTQHPHRYKIVEMLLSVFVGIEMTGQSVEFEQKFNYRRPMYAVIDYLWEMPEHVECFRKLAEEAEANMEGVNPPLFLKFANHLINDAIFLLDEALSNMAKLKEMQTAHENGEWNALSPQERAQNLGYMQHIGHLARFDNILGKDTTKTLEKLTSKITMVFTHQTMVDRIAAMLNYFLLNLVGPNSKNFKVKDSKEYSFDPASTVLDICQIYVNLKESDSFCLAISQDGRSYSPNLFKLAEDVLVRIGGGQFIVELAEVAQKVAEKSEESKANEEIMVEAPEHFLDPIMSTLMTDPVILPSSKQTVDRNTIARHLLSDQTDPFNRSPLSMDQVVPNVELKAEIEQWLRDREKTHPNFYSNLKSEN